ncbi:MAG TPA: SpoIIE family protein phosphatase, partial [Marmoricola sp.]
MQREPSRNAAREAALRLLEHLPGLAALYEGPELRITAMTAAAKALTGDLTGQTLPEAMPDVAGQRIHERIREVYETGEPFHGDEWRVQFRDAAGELREMFVNLVIEPLLGSTGEVRGVVSMATPVTGSVLARRHSEATSARLRQRAEDAQAMLLTLQDELLPDSLPVLPRLEVAANYLLADAGSSAGGDWFDVLALPDEHVALVVGDVVGHGVGASAVMGRLRAVLGERLLAGRGVVGALTDLDHFARHDREAHAATVCVADLDLADGSLRYCTAGHPPPVVVDALGVASYLPASGSGPLATGCTYAEAQHVLAEGDVLLLYTDGIVERPGRTVAQNTVELLGAATDAVQGRALVNGPSGGPADQIIRHLLEVLTRVSGFADDITLLAVQRRPPPPALHVDLPATVDSLRPALAALMQWLERQRAGTNDLMALAHAVGELVSNVIDHAYHLVEGAAEELFTLSAVLTRAGDAEVEVADGGAWREPERPAERGRGLAMASGLVDHLELDRRREGTTARATHRLHRPVELLTDTRGGPAGGRPPPG